MLDIRMLRADPAAATELLARRGDPGLIDAVDEALRLDGERREILAEVEILKAERNEVSRRIGDLKRTGNPSDELVASMQTVAERIRALDRRLSGVEEALRSELLGIPNLPDPLVPEGGDGDFLVVREWGEPVHRSDGSTKLPHWDLGESLGVLDIVRGARVAGSGFPLLVGQGARLSRGLIQFMLDLHTVEHGYTEIAPPFLVNRDALIGTGQLPKFEDDLYRTDPDDLFLVPTGEVPLTNLHAGEVLAEEDLPVAYTAYTPCFRREAGAAGQDTRGMLRVHQFDKVELVRLVTPETSTEQLELLTRHAETVLERLELPYRRILLPGGDLGVSNAITYDLEVWSAGVDRWLEVSSCSSYTDFQARRANLRYRPAAGGKPCNVHTLNGSGVALARTIVALLENNQQPDGTVTLPDALRPYVGLDRLEPR
ncbi:MAG: serine--tRNA ligase [Gemmatimonadales bacterium]|nr:MAG: serine--tRNA ligase [Gemmatimonadales bacterium]